MFSVIQKRQISDAVQKILKDTNHPELPDGEIKFQLHVDGAESWSWADIHNNGSVGEPSVNPHNEKNDTANSGELMIEINAGDFQELESMYSVAVENNEESFVFKDRRVLVEYAKYLIEYLTPKFKPTPVTHNQKIDWMKTYCGRLGAIIDLDGEVGFGRKCVGIVVSDTYPDYEWSDEETEKYVDNGGVWTPEDAYHKHPCVCVLGHGEHAESQLYEWLRWFDKNNFELHSGDVKGVTDQLRVLMGQHKYHRMVRPEK